jgi:hypothetical protein
MTNSDKTYDVSDKQTIKPSVTHADVYGDVGTKSQNSSPDANKKATEAQVQAGNLPSLSLDGQQNKHWWSGGLSVAEDLGKGVWTEATQHPLHLVESAAIGAAAGVALTFASPAVAIGAAVLGGGYAAYQVYENGSKWVHAVADEAGHTPQEIAAAHATVLGLGAGAADIAVGVGSSAIAGQVVAGLMAGSEAAPIAGAPASAASTDSSEIASTSDVTPVAELARVVPKIPDVPPPVDDVPPAPSILDQPEIWDRPARVPYTNTETTLQLANPVLWNSQVKKDGDNAYSALILRYSNKWATAMDTKMAAGVPLSKSMIMTTGEQSGAESVNAPMLSMIESLIGKTWQHGPEFSKIMDLPATTTP